MTTIERIIAAHAAATPGEWVGNNDGLVVKLQEDGDNCVICDCADEPALGASPEEIHNAEFIALAHNHMPELLEAVAVLEWIERNPGIHPHNINREAVRVLAKLKGQP